MSGRYNNKSGCVGVYQDRSGKWKAEIIVSRQYHNLGMFNSKEDAIEARKKAERRLLSVSK